MKKFKKVFAVLLTLAMVLGMSMTTFAANNSTITISGTGIDSTATVKYGQIIKEDRTSTLGWQFVNTTVKNAFVKAWNGANDPATTLDADGVIRAMIAANMLENPENANVEAGTINASANLSAALAAVTSAATTPMNITAGANVAATGKGLYIITAQKTGYTYLPMAAYMNSNGDDVAVVAKGSENQIKKTIAETGKSVAPGDEVDYEITEQYLYIAPNANPKTFTITDTLTNGTFKGGSVAVAIKDSVSATTSTPLTEGTDYTITDYAGKTTFTVDFGAKYNSAYAGKTVVITYKAVVGNVTTANNGALSNAVKSSNGTGKIVEVKPVSFTVKKVDEKNNEKVLKGAEFTIYKSATAPADGKETATLVKLNYNGGKVWAEVVDTITTGEDGTATINNLDAQGTYYVKETKAPNGYSLYDTTYALTGADVGDATSSTETKDGVTYTKETYSYTNFSDRTIEDTTLSALPSTGGIGTTIFTIGGCAIMIAAAAMFFASRRKNK